MKCLLVLFAAMSLVLLPVSSTEECGRPGRPLNGVHFHDMDGSAVYYCDIGFVLLGNKIRQCVNGTYTGDVPRCAEQREIDINEISPHKPAQCYHFVPHRLNEFSFHDSTVQSISWETNVKNWTESKRHWPFDINALSSEGWHLLKNGNEIRHLQIDDKNTVQVTFRKPIAHVSKLTILSDVDSVICNLKIFAIETEGKCEEPDSPVNGERVWYQYRSVATFKCDENFNLTSDLPLNCVNGKWTGLQPKCIPRTQEEQLDDSDEADYLPVTTGVSIVSFNSEEQLDGSGEDDNLPVSTSGPVDHEEEKLVDSDGAHNQSVTIGVPVTNKEQQLDGSGEDDNVTVSTSGPVVHGEKQSKDSDGTYNLPLIIGVPIGAIVLIIVVAVIIHKRKAGSYDAESA